jgi:cytochrome P450
MVTTREFIVVAAWHLLESPALRARYITGQEEARYTILNEILRVEPVVGVLYRRASADLQLEYGNQSFTIPDGDLIHLYIHAANTDESVVGEEPLSVCPDRTLHKSAQLPVMSFGSGRHRCPGAFIAIQETDIFLRKLLAIDDLRLVSEPTVAYKKLIEGYEVRNFIVAVD